MATEPLQGAIGVDLRKRIVVVSARPRGLIVQPPVEIAIPIASLKAVMSQVMLAEAQAEDGNAVLPLNDRAQQDGILPLNGHHNTRT